MANKKLFLRLNELMPGNKLMPLMAQRETAEYNAEDKTFKFNRFEFTSDLSRTETPVQMKTFVLEIFEKDEKAIAEYKKKLEK